jgi:hypothetical protein
MRHAALRVASPDEPQHLAYTIVNKETLENSHPEGHKANNATYTKHKSSTRTKERKQRMLYAGHMHGI